jgi:hypothetical protein
MYLLFRNKKYILAITPKPVVKKFDHQYLK